MFAPAIASSDRERNLVTVLGSVGSLTEVDQRLNLDF